MAVEPVSDRRRLGLVRSLCLLAGGSGAVTLALAFAGTTSPWARPWLFATFALGLTALQVMPLQLSHDGQGENLHLEEAFLLPMALVLTPAEALVGLAAAVAVGHLWRRRGWLKTLFNTGQMVTCAGVGLAVTRLLGASTGATGSRAMMAATAGVVVFAVLSMLVVAGTISVVERDRLTKIIFDGTLVRVATWVTSLAVGVLIASAMQSHLWTLPVTVLPIAMLQLIYSRAFGQYRERRKIEMLYDAAGSIRASMDSRRVLRQVLTSAQSLLDATDVRLVGTGAPPTPGTLRADIDDSVAVEVGARIGGGKWDDNDHGLLRAMASVASGALANATLFEQLRTVTSSLGEGVIALDRRGAVDFVNPAVEGALGWTEADLIGRSLHDTIHPHHAGHVDDCLLVAAALTGAVARQDDDAFRCKDGRLLPVAHTTSPVVRHGEVVGAVITFRDITERKAFEQQLAHQAFHDKLTGLSNRALFMDRLAHAHARAQRAASTYALLFIDLDRFKVVNDSLGHQAGDELLVAVAGRLNLCVRPSDTFARLGGDEFVVLLEDLDGEEGAVRVAERLLEVLREPFRIEGRELSTSASIGVVVGDGSHETPDHCLRDADVAMYRAKANGKARFEVFRAGSERADLERLDLEIALRLGIERGELELHYQPVVSLETVSVVGLEALVRWRHPTRGLLGPGEFIPLAEETGLILPLGRWVLEESCRQMRQWRDDNPSLASLVVSVNLSARQFRQPDLCEQVAEVLDATGLDARQLCLEVTESVMMDDADTATAMLHRLKRLGTCLSIDDFGTGYSSLGYLKRFPVDFVKIDRSFISDLGEGDVDSEIVRAVIRLSSAIGMRTVAEGVETEKQLRLLRDLGCPLVQGYYLARPQPAADIEKLLQERTERAEAGVTSAPGRIRQAAV